MTLEVRAVAHRYADVPVLKDVSLTIAAGEVVALLGASGSGKSTLLRLIAGLLPLQQGELWLDGALLARPGAEPPPERRPVGLMFQDHVLFPHCTVAENVGFGLHALAPLERARQVAGWLSRVGLENLADRYPQTLSGGQQQRVALVRALATKPEIMLLDEPFASVDTTRRRQLREDARLTLKAAGTTTIVVTHDPDEALELADHIAVMADGRIVQVGTPAEIWHAPNSIAVAELFGDCQLLPGERQGTQIETAIGTFDGFEEGVVSGPVTLLLRERSILLAAGSAPATGADIQARVVDVRFRAGQQLLFVERAGVRLRALAPAGHRYGVGDTVGLTLCPEAVRVFTVPAGAS